VTVLLLVGKLRPADRHGAGRGRAGKLMGKTLYVPMPDRVIEVEVRDTVFFDKEGVRLHG
jgi:hypothetical protein